MNVRNFFLYGCGVLLSIMSSQVGTAEDYSKYSAESLRKLLTKIATVEQKVLVPMRDGIGLSTDIYRPKNASGSLPTIFLRTPYNVNEVSKEELEWVVEAMERGYAYVIQNERGRYFSEGKFEILGRPRTDGYDALTWISEQPWSNKKVGTLGCSSSAEWQLALAAQDHPAHTAMVPMAAGAGIGSAGKFLEQGNWYTGGVPRTLFFVWLYGVDNPLRAQIPAGLSAETRAHISKYNDLAALKPEIDWKKQIKHLPISELLSDLGEPAGTFEELIRRRPNDPEWFNGGLYQKNEPWGVPALWFNSWYDVSRGPNLALFNHVRNKAGVDREVRNNQYAIIGPNSHCDFQGLGPDMVVGERNMGDTSFDTKGEIFDWFSRWLKNDMEAFDPDTPHVRYYTMGANKWQSDEQWPPEKAKSVRMYLHSGGNANSLYGDGVLSIKKPTGNISDSYYYDPMIPVPTVGGSDCCNEGLSFPGAIDQRTLEVRQDILVYTSDPLEEPMEVSGFIDAVLYVSSDAQDTDFAVKLVDVAPDGTAYIIDDTILRARYREGYEKEVMMEKGEIYKLSPTPMVTSNTFKKGHKIRIEITSSNFPKFVRNLNTGGANYDEKEGVIAHNTLHLSAEHPSYIILPVID